jgi:hypothetical protein
MSESESPSGTTEATASGATQEKEQETSSTSGADLKDSVAYDTYRKVLSEKKKASEKLTNLEAELQKMKEERLQLEGKKDEYIDTLKKKLTDLETNHKKAVGTFAYNAVTNALQNEALKHGCIDSDALIKLVDVSSLEVSDDFKVDGENLKTTIEDLKKSKPYLFSKEAPKFADAKKPVVDVKQSGLKGKSVDELSKMLANLNNQTKN